MELPWWTRQPKMREPVLILSILHRGGSRFSEMDAFILSNMSAGIATKIFSILFGLPHIAHIAALRYSIIRAKSLMGSKNASGEMKNSWKACDMPTHDEPQELQPSTKPIISANPVKVPIGEAIYPPLPNLNEINHEVPRPQARPMAHRSEH